MRRASALAAVLLASVSTCSSLDGCLDGVDVQLARRLPGRPSSAFVLARPSAGSPAGSLLQKRPPTFRTAAGRPLRGAASRRACLPSRTSSCSNWVCQVGGGFREDPDSSWGGDDDLFSEGADEGADWRTVLLKDVKLDRTIECFVDREIEVDGKQYATLLPADTPVIMAGYKLVNGSQQLVPVLEDKAIDELFPTAFAVLSEMDLTLSRSAVVLTVEENEGSMSLSDSEDDDEDEDYDDDQLSEVMVVGMGPNGETTLSFSLLDDEEEEEDEDSEDDVLSLGSGPSGAIGLRKSELIDLAAGEVDGPRGLGFDDEDSDEEAEDESEKVQVLASFYYQGDKYVVATPLEPVLIIGSPVVKEAEKKPQLHARSDLELIRSLPGSPGLLSDLEDAEDSNLADYLLPDREELERVTPKIEQELESMWDVEEKERKVLVRLRQQLINQWERTE